MGDYTYYCEVTRSREDIKSGTYSFVASGMTKFNTRGRLLTVSDRVWRQGPKGGVKIIKDISKQDWGQLAPTVYVTRNEELMKQFMWVKLQAQPYVK